jgi:carbamate kinase
MNTAQRETLVVALGGNAIKQAGERGTSAEQFANVARAAEAIAALVERGDRVVITHGNGPQVGSLLLQQAAGAKDVPPLPMDVCGAMTQGWIGYMISQALGNALARRDHPAAGQIATIVTQVLVDAADPAFQQPTKPVGPFNRAEIAQRMADAGVAVVEDSGRGWRRVVPSPTPIGLVEIAAVRRLVDAGLLVITSGGGGVPVVRDAEGQLHGVEAVIDKDLAGALLARELGATRLLILTDVEQVALDYKKPTQRPLAHLRAADARAYLAAGQFAAGSMGPKVRAAVEFVEAGGRQAIITQLYRAVAALAGETGTIIET